MVAGHLCLDIIPEFPDTGVREISELVRPGKLVNINDATISTGGSVSNTGIPLKILGNSVAFCARVGDDSFGKLIVELLQKNGNADGINIVNGAVSSYSVVLAPVGIDRIILHNPGANNSFNVDDLNIDLINQCKHFHFGYPPLMRSVFENECEQLAGIFKLAKNAGAVTSCDMTLPDPDSESGKINWRSAFEKMLPYVDIFFPSIEEAFYALYPEKFLEMKENNNNADLVDFFTMEDYNHTASELLSMGPTICALKSGHRGFYLKTKSKNSFITSGIADTNKIDVDNWADRELVCPAFFTKNLKSANGAGDSSIAGFLTAMFKGCTIEKTLKYANCLGWQNVQTLDAVSGIHSWEETTEFLNSSIEINSINLSDKNWSYNEQLKIWISSDDKVK